MQMILGLIFAAIFVYVGVNLEPGLNTTVATITTPTYSSGVAGLNGVSNDSPSSQRWLEQTLNIGGSLRWLSRHTALVIGKVLETTKGQLVRVDGIVRSAFNMKMQLTLGVMIVFAAIRLKIVALGSNPHRITCQIRENLNSERGMAIAELSGMKIPKSVETRRQASQVDDGIVRHPRETSGLTKWIIFGVKIDSATRLRNLVKKLPEFGGKLRCQYRAKQQIKNLWACVTTRGEVSPFGDSGMVWTMANGVLKP